MQNGARPGAGAGQCTRGEAGGITGIPEEGWCPAVLGTGGIQEDRMPGTSNRQIPRPEDLASGSNDPGRVLRDEE